MRLLGIRNSFEFDRAPRLFPWTSDLFGLEPFWRGWLEPVCIGCESTDFYGGVEWISRLRSSKSASNMPNIVVAKPSIVVTSLI